MGWKLKADNHFLFYALFCLPDSLILFIHLGTYEPHRRENYDDDFSFHIFFPFFCGCYDHIQHRKCEKKICLHVKKFLISIGNFFYREKKENWGKKIPSNAGWKECKLDRLIKLMEKVVMDFFRIEMWKFMYSIFEKYTRYNGILFHRHQDFREYWSLQTFFLYWIVFLLIGIFFLWI